MKKVIAVFFCLIIVFAFTACSSDNEETEASIDPELIQYSGEYLVDSITISDDGKSIDQIVLSANNLDDIGISQKDLLSNFRIYEAQVIWDINNQCFYLDKGYDIGEDNIAFANTELIYSSSMDTGEVDFTLLSQDFEFEEYGVYNFCCTYQDRKFDSYFVYIPYENGSFQAIRVDDLEYSYVNCVYDDYDLYLAAFQGMTGDNDDEPSYACFGDPIAVRDNY